jgi:Mannosyl-glycoprotein endo-beta-N-acetylglucosaminidase/LysM domain
MQKIRNIFAAVLIASISTKAQPFDPIISYIYTYKQLAIDEMKRTGVPAAITLAQGIHESGAGKSKLALKSNNHFGIKCKTNWAGEKVYHDDDAKGECFRKYPAVDHSYKDHSDFLKNGERYAFLFAIDPEDYAAWAAGLKKAGYATNPKYPQVLIKLVEDYGLQHYTLIAIGKIPDQAFELANEGSTNNNPVVVDNTTGVTNKQKTEEAVEPAKKFPEGVFKINETKVIFIKKETPFIAIAKQHDVDLSKIFEFNEIPRAELAQKDMLLYLQRKRKTGSDEFHIVQPGETLHDISQLQAIRLESLLELNWLGKNEIPAPGAKLNLKKKSANMPELVLKNNYSISGDKN